MYTALRALAVYRLTKLVIDDKITEPLREKLFEKHPPESTMLGYLGTCPYCVSIYAAALLSSVHMIAPNSRLVRAGTEALALSAVTGILYEREGAAGF